MLMSGLATTVWLWHLGPFQNPPFPGGRRTRRGGPFALGWSNRVFGGNHFPSHLRCKMDFLLWGEVLYRCRFGFSHMVYTTSARIMYTMCEKPIVHLHNIMTEKEFIFLYFVFCVSAPLIDQPCLTLIQQLVAVLTLLKKSHALDTSQNYVGQINAAKFRQIYRTTCKNIICLFFQVSHTQCVRCVWLTTKKKLWLTRQGCRIWKQDARRQMPTHLQFVYQNN
jgi:hypothetical protein